MYFVLTAAEVVFLMFGGMSFYDALLHSFSTAEPEDFPIEMPVWRIMTVPISTV